MSEKTKKGDFVELKYTGYANGEIFDSNIEEDLKKINTDAKPHKSVIVIGQKMVVNGLDSTLENKEFNKEYEVLLSREQGFGERRRELIKTIPLAAFREQRVNPRPGMMLTLDNTLVKIIAVSGARVTADLNNPLAGKTLKYKFTITRKIESENEKAEALLDFFFRFVPEFEVKEAEVVVKMPKGAESFINIYKEKFKEIIGKELVFEEKKPEKDKLEDKLEENKKE